MAALGAEIGHLAPGVDPGVSAARADEGDLVSPREPPQRRFHHLLDGNGVHLALPAVIAGAVVFQEQADVAARIHSAKVIGET